MPGVAQSHVARGEGGEGGRAFRRDGRVGGIRGGCSVPADRSVLTRTLIGVREGKIPGRRLMERLDHDARLGSTACR